MQPATLDNGARAPRPASTVRQGLRRSIYKYYKDTRLAAAEGDGRQACSRSSRSARRRSGTSRCSALERAAANGRVRLRRQPAASASCPKPAVARLRVDRDDAREDHVAGHRTRTSAIKDQVFVETVEAATSPIKVENNTTHGPRHLPRAGRGHGPGARRRRDLLRDQARAADPAQDQAVPRANRTATSSTTPAPGRSIAHRRDRPGCAGLPEDRGMVVPRTATTCTTGDTKRFEGELRGHASSSGPSASPNGEDVLYVFHRRDRGPVRALPVQPDPQGDARTRSSATATASSRRQAGDLPRVAANEPTRVHPMQIWQTPFMTAEFAAAGADERLVPGQGGQRRPGPGISDALSMRRAALDRSPTRRRAYEDLIKTAERMARWTPTTGSATPRWRTPGARKRRSAGRLRETIVDEFEKVEAHQKLLRRRPPPAGRRPRQQATAAPGCGPRTLASARHVTCRP